MAKTVSFRHIDSPLQIKNVPPFSSADPPHIPSRSAFLLRTSLTTLICTVLVDASGQRIPPSPSDLATVFSPARIPLLTRPDNFASDRLKLRALLTLGFWSSIYFFCQAAYGAMAVLAVSLGSSPPKSWPPFFGSVADAYTLRNFWG